MAINPLPATSNPLCAKTNTMSSYFSRFPEFDYNSRNQEDLEFGRLREIQGWEPHTLTYKNEYRAFLVALVKEKGDATALDRFFITGYPNFDYKIRASPKLEFRRLQRYQGWDEGSAEYTRAKALFKTAYDQQFNGALDKFFNSYPNFDYNPRSEPKSEFERLREHKEWHLKPGEHYLDRSYNIWLRKDEYREARGVFFEKFVEDFTDFFGQGDELKDWIYLCDVLQVYPTPSTIYDCKIVSYTHYKPPYPISIHLVFQRIILACVANQYLKETSAPPCQYMQPAPSRTAKSTPNLPQRSGGPCRLY